MSETEALTSTVPWRTGGAFQRDQKKIVLFKDEYSMALMSIYELISHTDQIDRWKQLIESYGSAIPPEALEARSTELVGPPALLIKHGFRQGCESAKPTT